MASPTIPYAAVRRVLSACPGSSAFKYRRPADIMSSIFHVRALCTPHFEQPD